MVFKGILISIIFALSLRFCLNIFSEDNTFTHGDVVTTGNMNLQLGKYFIQTVKL